MSKSALTWTSKAFHLTALSTALVLAGCGGGGSSVDSIVPAPDLGVVPTPSDNQAESESSNNNYALYMTSSVPALMLNRGTTVKVSVRAVDGKTYGVVADKEVKFSITDPTLTGVFNQNAGVVKTDKQGVATITLEVVNTLTPEQKQHLKDKGLTITASLGNGQATLNLKGTDKKVTAEKNSVYDLYITTSKPRLKTGTDTMTVTVNVRNKDGGIESGVPVNFSIIDPVKYGITLAGKSSQITDEKGQVQIQLEQSSTTSLSRLNHETKLVITVDDTKNAVETMSLPLQVVGTRILGISSNLNMISNQDRVNITGRLIDGSDRSIANIEVALMNANKQIASVKTDSNGQFTFSGISSTQLIKEDDGYIFDIVVNPNPKKDELQTFNAAIKLAAVVDKGISISRVSDIVVDKIEEIEVLVPDASNGDKVTLTTTKGRFTNDNGSQNGSSSQTATISNGKAVFKIRSIAPGVFNLTATYKNKKQSKNLRFVSVKPDKLLLQAKNIQMTTNSSTEVKVRVLDAKGGAVKNAIVNFSVVEDSSGGHIDQAIVKTDENGIGVIAYTSGNNPTANGGVRIQAKVNAVELPDGKVNTVSVGPAEVKLTVQTTASSIAVGLSDKISDDESKVYYFRNGSAFVTNNSGQPAANQLITISLKPKTYIKGKFKVVIKNKEKLWEQESQECANEDRNFNSILDMGEDNNNNGQLDPGYKASILSKNLVSTSNNGVYNLITDENGRADFQIRYLKEYADWFTMDMTAATLVDGSESSQLRGVYFPILSDDQDISLVKRPNLRSPFGIHPTCK
ncbi:hypothetical protein [Moraxella lincolnii]|uniref:Big-1 domain-containing protein n=1 Tax=Lwoffella lincolnii TaxID=90241 RepID=A0A1T0CBJ7_9GAMM|nr:hypothetical protein [Moraxella lincolnii]OOS19491.1 hypothetical protein B0682_08770 [Moraxella lincolnii]